MGVWSRGGGQGLGGVGGVEVGEVPLGVRGAARGGGGYRPEVWGQGVWDGG